MTLKFKVFLSIFTLNIFIGLYKPILALIGIIFLMVFSFIYFIFYVMYFAIKGLYKALRDLRGGIITDDTASD